MGTDDAEHQHSWIVPRELFHGEPRVIAALLEKHGLRCAFGKTAHAALLRSGHHTLGSAAGGGGAWRLARPELHPPKRRADRQQQCDVAPGSRPPRPVVRYRWHLARLAAQHRSLLRRQLASCAVRRSRICGAIARHHSRAKRRPAPAWGEPEGQVNRWLRRRIGQRQGARDGTVHQWRSTANGLEGIAARCSDGCLVLDEISQSEAKEAGERSISLPIRRASNARIAMAVPARGRPGISSFSRPAN